MSIIDVIQVTDALASIFEFELGGKLEVIPDQERGIPRDVWLLYEPSGDVFTLQNDGQYRRAPGETSRGQETWPP